MRTYFQTADLGTRLDDDDPLLGVVIKPISISCRILLVGGWAGLHVVAEMKARGWGAVILWSSSVGKKYDLSTPTGRGHLASLAASGHVIGFVWILNSSLRFEAACDAPVTTMSVAGVEEAPGIMSSLNDFLHTVFANMAGAVGCVLHLDGGDPFFLHAQWRHIVKTERCCYDRANPRETISILATHRSFLALATSCPFTSFSLSSEIKAHHDASNHFIKHGAGTKMRAGVGRIPLARDRPLGRGLSHQLAAAWDQSVRVLHTACHRTAAGRSSRLAVAEAELAPRLPEGPLRVFAIDEFRRTRARQ